MFGREFEILLLLKMILEVELDWTKYFFKQKATLLRLVQHISRSVSAVGQPDRSSPLIAAKNGDPAVCPL